MAGTGLGACSAAPGGTDLPKHDPIVCALKGVKTFTPGCTVERLRDRDSLFLTVRHPDGGFRRFEVSTDGTGLAVADGAKPAEIIRRKDAVDVKVDDDFYRIPVVMMDRVDKP